VLSRGSRQRDSASGPPLTSGCAKHEATRSSERPSYSPDGDKPQTTINVEFVTPTPRPEDDEPPPPRLLPAPPLPTRPEPLIIDAVANPPNSGVPIMPRGGTKTSDFGNSDGACQSAGAPGSQRRTSSHLLGTEVRRCACRPRPRRRNLAPRSRRIAAQPARRSSGVSSALSALPNSSRKPLSPSAEDHNGCFIVCDDSGRRLHFFLIRC
jgi:hypothetical protein